MDKLYVGLSASFEVLISSSMLENFVVLSGDNSPLHTDASFAIKKGYAGIVVHGLLSAAFYSRLVGVHLLGNKGYSQEYKFSYAAPVYIGECLTVQGEIEYINEGQKQVWIKAFMTNAHGVKVSRATIKAGIFEDVTDFYSDATDTLK